MKAEEGVVGCIELAEAISGPQVDGWRAPRQPPFIVKYAPPPLFMITNASTIPWHLDRGIE